MYIKELLAEPAFEKNLQRSKKYLLPHTLNFKQRTYGRI